ncbi:flavodoxin domain-containing protein [Streptomyces sp. WAC 00631]|uniref:flavodoxin domain-containing protein n=1 Tax=unclassified Streptomyces TaxID=2593676 RepID=UPI000F7775E6|nr:MULTISPECIES: flavodoxin domain-containing protein [unclassified Streptomyces]MCC5033870.1 flavodoxin domain-containing protein [Streptomyces sp. WAC 00631]MCC9742740.1 flavodoxin domain-containing protein [Streptomyces sp. MNU89]
MLTAQRVLVTYGSKHGSTADIAQWIGDVLRAREIDVVVLPASGVQDLEPYDAVVIGGGLYAGRWQKDAARFARRNRSELDRRPVWLFSSGPLDSSASEGEIPPPKAVARIAERVHARGHMTFGGRLAEDSDGFLTRRLVAEGRGGDFRDREQVRAWGERIAAEVGDTEPPG